MAHSAARMTTAATVIAIAAALAGCGGSATGGPVGSGTAPAKAADVEPVKVRTLLDVQGNGIKQTATFNTSDDWAIAYGYNCAGFGQAGNFQVMVYNSDGSLAGVAVNELAMHGADSTAQHVGGSVYLEVNSECSWHIIVKG